MENEFILTNMILLVISIIIIFLGLVILFAPARFDKLSRTLERVLGIFDVKILTNRILWGVIFCLSAVYLFYTAYSL